ncbi:NUDIX hydrolase [Tenuifilum thalassicum]|uniref:CoA pyrophosphatase n=1 Tax=Tenuifilum thalassicum TaxID=2590900 RepID=A0A7D3XDM4_9BACT|nr:CoA pyrophosphatase [Tenuifilum thalassicum]QKG79207.1 CoA pyrophosphatase [Tenuifilum thalassicum]
MKEIVRNAIERLRYLLKAELPGKDAQIIMAPSVRADKHGNSKPNLSTRESAVLILLYRALSGLRFVLIKRQVYDGPHSGQVSLPGGKFEENDISISQTALRETYEEIGVEPKNVDLLGRLTELYIPVSNMIVHPFVGYINETPNFNLNLLEVQYIVEVDLFDLIDDRNKSVKVINSHGYPITAPYYNLKDEMVWGATAMILSEFEHILKKVLL